MKFSLQPPQHNTTTFCKHRNRFLCSVSTKQKIVQLPKDPLAPTHVGSDTFAKFDGAERMWGWLHMHVRVVIVVAHTVTDDVMCNAHNPLLSLSEQFLTPEL
jgi:hypothetical protein